MEKASKILLIFSIVFFVISSTVFVNENMHRTSSGGFQPESLAVQAHNSMFDTYIDKTVKGRAVKKLCSKISSYNTKADLEYIVTIKMSNGLMLVDGAQLKEEDIKTAIITYNNYHITGGYNDNTGVITEIIVTPKS